MKIFVSVFLVAFCIQNAVSFGFNFPKDNADHNSFDVRLLKEVLGYDSKNTVISPYSVKFLLTLLADAATDGSVTEQELRQSILPGSTKFETGEYFAKRVQALNKQSEGFSLKIASGLFLDKSISANDGYSHLLRQIYQSPIQKIDFGNVPQSVKSVNDWAAKVTDGNINKIVSDDDLQGALAVLLNGVHFDAKWDQPFPHEEDFIRPFFPKGFNSGEMVKAPFMGDTGEFLYTESSELDAAVLKLPYKNKEFSMYIYLPNGNLDDLLKKLTPESLNNVRKATLTYTFLEVSIPKFDFEFESRLVPTLEKLGIQKAFTDAAEFGAFNKAVKLSNVVQKAKIAVDEDGTTASAVTLGSLVNKFGKDSFDANHPFLFVIEHENTNTILFAGKVTNPIA